MDDAVLNRTGILLSFVAGFLIAPELIGIKRLQRLEVFVESLGTRLDSFLERTRERVGQDRVVLAIAGLGCAPILLFIVSMVLYGFGVRSDFFYLAFQLYPLIIISVGLMYGWVLVLLLLLGIQRAMSRLVRALAGGDRLVSWAVALGITFYVVGNLLQLTATF